jgi:RHS repeat-associated protein
MRGPGSESATVQQLEQAVGSGVEYGLIGYTHAGGVDRPLVVWKGSGGATSDVVVPHLNWRGLFGRGTNANGDPTGIIIEWPGFQTTAYHTYGQTQAETRNWMGSLLEGQRDAGGQMYMRNRYYDPQTGQFTQPDPIGIAGGLNVYGFAAGDPISYDDPYGLSAEEIKFGHAAGSCGWCEDWDMQPGPRSPRRGSGPSFGGGRSAIPGGSLRANEGRGHTIRVHVNVTQADILRRARTAGAARSRFTDLRTAEQAVEAALQSNQTLVSLWLQPGGYRQDLPIRFNMNRSIGEVAFPNGTITQGRTVRVVLRRDRYNLRYWVHTAMVEP